MLICWTACRWCRTWLSPSPAIHNSCYWLLRQCHFHAPGSQSDATFTHQHRPGNPHQLCPERLTHNWVWRSVSGQDSGIADNGHRHSHTQTGAHMLLNEALIIMTLEQGGPSTFQWGPDLTIYKHPWASDSLCDSGDNHQASIHYSGFHLLFFCEKKIQWKLFLFAKYLTLSFSY